MAAPTVLYPTPSGEIHGWHALGQADCYKAKGQVPGLVQGEVCLTLTRALACVGVSSPQQVVLSAFLLTTMPRMHRRFPVVRLLRRRQKIKNAKELRHLAVAFSRGLAGVAILHLWTTQQIPPLLVSHPGTVAVRNAPNGQDKALECCVVRSAGPERPGELFLDYSILDSASGAATSNLQVCVQTSQLRDY